jgi:hypothetical protein
MSILNMGHGGAVVNRLTAHADTAAAPDLLLARDADGELDPRGGGGHDLARRQTAGDQAEACQGYDRGGNENGQFCSDLHDIFLCSFIFRFYAYIRLDVRPDQKVSISYKYSRNYPYQTSFQNFVKKLRAVRELPAALAYETRPAA